MHVESDVTQGMSVLAITINEYMWDSHSTSKYLFLHFPNVENITYFFLHSEMNCQNVPCAPVNTF